MSSLTIDLKGKVVLITGGAGLQGAEHVKAFKKTGATVVSSDIKGGNIYLDVTSEDSIEKAVKEILEKHKQIDVLVNNAGIIGIHMKKAAAVVEDQKLEDWENILRVNLTGVWLCSQKVGTVMAKQGGGSIISVSSIYGVVAPDFSIYKKSKYKSGKAMGTPAAYVASKAGVISLTRYLASYWADKGVRVNCVTPGGIYNNQSKEFVENYAKRVPMGRMAKKNEVSGAVLYLASDLSSYVTGANIVIDGGLTIKA